MRSQGKVGEESKKAQQISSDIDIKLNIKNEVLNVNIVL